MRKRRILDIDLWWRIMMGVSGSPLEHQTSSFPCYVNQPSAHCPNCKQFCFGNAMLPPAGRQGSQQKIIGVEQELDVARI